MMRRVNNNRRIMWGVAATVLAAAFLLASAGTGDAQTDELVIDTAAPVQRTQCAACHLDLGSVDVPGLIFSHGNHLLVSCDGCHSRLPHRDGATDRVPMEVCFACHGVQHGPQGELASSECDDCHTPSFTLRPRTHVEDWAKQPHADAADRSGVNGCLMCHDGAKDCDDCHKSENLDIPEMPETYHTIVNPLPKGPSTYIYPERPVSMSQCIFCHPDIDDIVPGRLIFAHADHIQRNYRCEACHETFAHTPTTVDKPDMMSCYRCHDSYHNGGGLIAEGEDCGACHPAGFELMPSDHTNKFIKGTHSERAGVEPEYCMMCHPSQFCVDCHNGVKTSPNAPGKKVIPASHQKAQWRSQHGPQFMDAQGACGACHDGPSCQLCHYTVLPHPVGWIENHKPDPGVAIQDCYVCHTDRNECQNCHHRDVKTAELIAENCEPCHDEMKLQPPTDIKHKGFAEHAVHFNVAETKGKPYRCYECHVDFGTSEAAQQLELQQGHDLRLCYDCHGALDPFNRQIAPYKGASLCIRCHKDVGV